jgi:ketosteroid isomerase-like protein
LIVAAAPERPSNTLYRWEPLGGGVARDGRTGYTYGLGIVVTGAAQAEEPRAHGASVRVSPYLAFWRRATDNTWRIAAYAEVDAPAVPNDSALPPSGFAPTLSLPRGRRADAVRQVREADSAFALAADLQGAGVAFSTFAAPQGVLFSGTEVVTTPAAVRALLEERQRRGSTLNWRPVYADAAESGDLGMTIGESVIMGRSEATGSVFQRFGKYLTIWQRQPNGSWRFVVHGGNLSPTPGR